MAIHFRNKNIKDIHLNWRKAKAVYLWSTKIRPEEADREQIVFKMMADNNWDLYVPISNEYTSGMKYKWRISIDWWNYNNYNWDVTYRSMLNIGSWYTPLSEHTITIKPQVIEYRWAWWFNFENTNCASLLTEVLIDWSYIGYAQSETNTWSYFRLSQFYWCSNLRAVPDEYMPNTVTTIGAGFRDNQFDGCTSLVSAPKEAFSNAVTTIQQGIFRYQQYRWCTSLVSASNEAFSDSVTDVWVNFRYQQYYWCTSLLSAWREAFSNNVTTIKQSFRRWQYYECTSLLTASDEAYSTSTTSMESYFRAYQYYWCSSLLTAWAESPIDVVNISRYREEQYCDCWALTSANLYCTEWWSNQFFRSWTNLVVTIRWNVVKPSTWNLNSYNVDSVYVPNALLSSYQSSSVWGWFSNKFIWY